MADVFVASKEPPKNGYGQNGYQGPSSDLPGQSTRTAVSDVAPKQIGVPGLREEDTLAHRVKMDGDKASAYAPHSGMAHRGVSDGSPGGIIPAAPVRANSGKMLSPSTFGRSTK